MNYKTDEYFKKWKEDGGSYLHFITTRDDYLYTDYILEKMRKAYSILNIKKDGKLNSLALPIDIVINKWKKSVEKTAPWILGGKIYTDLEDRYSYHLMFNKPLTEEEVLRWNMWMMGYFSK